MNDKIKAFTLLEILVAMTMVSFVLIGAVSLSFSYVRDLRWNQLFDRLEGKILEANTLALAGFSKKDLTVSGDLQNFPDMIHLYLEKGKLTGDDEKNANIWFLESKQKTGQSLVNVRTISFQDFFDLDLFPLELENMVLRQGKDEASGKTVTLPHVFLTWSLPLSRLSFRTGIMPSFQEIFPNEITFDAPYKECDDNPSFCTLTLNFSRPGTTEEKSLILDLQKGLQRLFY